MALNIGGKIRGLIHRYAPHWIKQRIWDRDYSIGRYGYGSTTADFLYPILVRYLHGGNLLDLGCGEGKTANELDAKAYSTLVGVDISEVAVSRAKAWSERSGRASKNSFFCSDIDDFMPSHRFDVVLFRDSIYYLRQIQPTLRRYSGFLAEGGCFVARFCADGTKTIRIVSDIEANFEVIEKQSENSALAVIFRPRA